MQEIESMTPAYTTIPTYANSTVSPVEMAYEKTPLVNAGFSLCEYCV